jgi:hypothetical protein
MRASLIVLLLAVAGGAGYYFYQQSGRTEAAAVEATPAQVSMSTRPSDGAGPALFNDICIAGRESFAQTESRALAAGWTLAPDDIHPNVARIMAISRGASVPQASNVVMRAYAHPERPQYIVLTGMNVSGSPVNGCYIYDFGATQLPDLGALEASLGVPTERISEPGIVDSKKWVGPAALPSVATLRVGYFPLGSPAEAQLGFNGLVLALTSMSR